MIQRIQSIWLLLAAVCVFLTMVFSTYAGADAAGLMHLIKGREISILAILTSAVGVASLINIFLFSNRKWQRRTIVSIVLLDFILLFFYYKAIINLEGKGTFGLAGLLHVCVIVFLLLAYIGIRADDKLIKDSNRLR